MFRFLTQLRLFATVLVVACSTGTPPRDLRDLVLQDSLYHAPESMAPYTGSVFRPFPGDSTRTEIEAALVEGEWHGEMVVYHPSGRIRYLGAFASGERCGPWTEGALDLEPVNLYAELRSDIETMAIYPACPPDL